MMTSLEESPSSLNSAFKSGKEGGTKWLGIGELRQVFTAVYIAMNGMIREDWDIIGRWLDEIKTSIYCVLTLRKLLCQLKKLGMKWTIPAWGGVKSAFWFTLLNYSTSVHSFRQNDSANMFLGLPDIAKEKIFIKLQLVSIVLVR